MIHFHDPGFDTGRDLAGLGEDALALLAQNGNRAAMAELDRQCGPFREGRIRRLAAAAGLSAPEVEDALQWSFFWTVHAVEEYRREQAGPGGFRALLGRVLETHFRKHVATLRAAGRRKQRAADRAAAAAAEQEPRASDEVWVYGPTGGDPCREAQQHELQQRYQRAVGRLPDIEQRAWRSRCDGETRVERCEVMTTMTYEAFRGVDGRMIGRLRAELRERDDGPSRGRPNPG